MHFVSMKNYAFDNLCVVSLSRNILSNPAFREYTINRRVLFWACDVNTNEGRRGMITINPKQIHFASLCSLIAYHFLTLYIMLGLTNSINCFERLLNVLPNHAQIFRNDTSIFDITFKENSLSYDVTNSTQYNYIVVFLQHNFTQNKNKLYIVVRNQRKTFFRFDNIMIIQE